MGAILKTEPSKKRNQDRNDDTKGGHIQNPIVIDDGNADDSEPEPLTKTHLKKPTKRDLYKKATQEVLAAEASCGRDFELCIEEEEAKIGRMTFFSLTC
ncbi:hypothetical protein RHSIM_Rhsim13G0097400 [Rhododendron simsii]|uniref:Uncharacterized protein n=1 Tax=Rhododendron simsii TaxID=118357 RepID=A0A834L888_RHOSS|nr:hypothetical protein RHSIM_Rhsim13G0097400 [Rhododendron simsii]